MSKMSLDFSKVTTPWGRVVTTLLMKGIEQPKSNFWLLWGLSKLPGVDLNAREAKSGQACVVRAMVKKKPRFAFMLANDPAVDPATRDYTGLSARILAQRTGMKEVEDALISRGAPWTAADDKRMKLLKEVDSSPQLRDLIGFVQMNLYAIGESEGDIPSPLSSIPKVKTNRFLA